MSEAFTLRTRWVSPTSRNGREGHYFGKINGQPKRVHAAMRAEWMRARRHRQRWNFQFGPVKEY